MGSCVLKANRTDDLYCIWSSIVDAPTVVGTREEIKGELVADFAPGRPRYEEELERAEQAMARADEHGSSARAIRFGWWDDEDLLVRAPTDGMLRREDLAAFLRSFLEADEDAEDEGWDVSLLRPCEEDL